MSIKEALAFLKYINRTRKQKIIFTISKLMSIGSKMHFEIVKSEKYS